MHLVWEAALEELRGRLSHHTFAAWLAPLRFEAFESPTLRVRVPHRFFADWISPRYLPDLLETVGRLAGAPCSEVDWIVDPGDAKDGKVERISGSVAAAPAARQDVRFDASARRPTPARPRDRRTAELPFEALLQAATLGVTSAGNVVAPTTSAGQIPAAPASQGHTATSAGQISAAPPGASPTRPPAPRTPARGVARRELDDSEYALNPRYQFDSFVVGASNQLAHAAGIAASSAPGRRYNPLFIYSKVGLGKTHLVNAVGHRVREDRPDARVLFLSAERFTNDFISALQHRRIDEFRARYRTNCDVLILDDIQFLAGREQTQEEFFHTFNALYHADKQIVVTSDVYPQQIAEMQDRLISRFQWGLVADIQAPELDTRIAILRKKADSESLQLTDDVALFVAQRVQSNVRELEGTLLRLAMRADVERRPLDLALAKAMLGEPVLAQADRLTSVEDIQRAACEFFGLSMKELLSDRRHRGVSLPRMVAMYVARERLKLSYPDIGRRFGGKDHTTVMSAVRKIGALLQTDEQVQRAVERIEKKLGLA